MIFVSTESSYIFSSYVSPPADINIATLTGVNVWRKKVRRTLSFMQLAPAHL